ncbi:hypothetical protein CYMTET_27613 [Cymbomonas tetramitiformis]|uniref:Uncharacterized protein n=1 Tax=Cymbomonas tetramitiformis TaxID=36881 RepID=A0AAE0FPE1_9CHLO|nr:hypothetical protein CYMTET_27613 [Cymbomonas tetramitiformis]
MVYGVQFSSGNVPLLQHKPLKDTDEGCTRYGSTLDIEEPSSSDNLAVGGKGALKRSLLYTFATFACLGAVIVSFLQFTNYGDADPEQRALPQAHSDGAPATQRLCDFSEFVVAQDEAALPKGYVLSTQPGKHWADLIDFNGNVKHRWFYGAHPIAKSAVLTPEGHLFFAAHDARNDATSLEKLILEDNDVASELVELDWDSKVVRMCALNTRHDGDESVYFQHHDQVMMPNGNYLVIAGRLRTWDDVAAHLDVPKSLVAKRSIHEVDGHHGYLVEDGVMELKHIHGMEHCEVVWEWWSLDHVIQDVQEGSASYGEVASAPQLLDFTYYDEKAGPQFTHLNSIDYDPSLDQILINSMVTAEVYFIDHSTTTEEAGGRSGGKYGRGGDYLYRWGNDAAFQHSETGKKCFHSHGAKWVPRGRGFPNEGSVMWFDNGHFRMNPDIREAKKENEDPQQFIKHIARKYNVDIADVVLHQSGVVGLDQSAMQVFTPKQQNGVYSTHTNSTTFQPKDFALSCDVLPKACMRFGGVVPMPNGTYLVTCGFTPSAFEEAPADGGRVWKLYLIDSQCKLLWEMYDPYPRSITAVDDPSSPNFEEGANMYNGMVDFVGRPSWGNFYTTYVPPDHPALSGNASLYADTEECSSVVWKKLSDATMKFTKEQTQKIQSRWIDMSDW